MPRFHRLRNVAISEVWRYSSLYTEPGSTHGGVRTQPHKDVGDDGWFVYFRLYAPLQPFFDKTFKLPDFQRLD